MRRSWIGLLSLVACGGPRAADPASPPPADPTTVTMTVDGPDASVPDAAVPDATPLPTFTLPDDRPGVKGTRLAIAVGESTKHGALTITFAYNSHKHRADGGGSIGIFGFVFARGGKKLEHEVRGQEGPWEAEIDALGTLVVLEHVSYDEFAATIAAKKTPPPLTEDACAAMIEDAAAKAALPSGDGSAQSEENGFVHYDARQDGRPLWRGVCGVYTKRIWFEPGAE